MRRFFESEALRIQRGESGLVGDTITFESDAQANAEDLQAALADLGIGSEIVKDGKLVKVRLHALPVGTPAQPEPVMDVLTPADVPSPAETKGVAATPETSQNIPNFIPKAAQPSPPSLTPKEKRRRFADLAKQEPLSTGSELTEEQAQRELSFTAAKGKRSKGPNPMKAAEPQNADH